MDQSGPDSWFIHLGGTVATVLVIAGSAMAYVLREIGLARSETGVKVDALRNAVAADVQALRETDDQIQRDMVRRDELNSLREDVRNVGVRVDGGFLSLGERVDQILLRTKSMS